MRGIRIITSQAGSKRLVFRFAAYGHRAILAEHPTTLEITSEDHVTAGGDCIVAVRATSSLVNLPPQIKKIMSSQAGVGELTIQAKDRRFMTEGRGSEGLTFSHPREIVVRRSDFVSGRTLMVRANKGAADIPRNMVRLLQDPDQEVTITLSVTTNHRVRSKKSGIGHAR